MFKMRDQIVGRSLLLQCVGDKRVFHTFDSRSGEGRDAVFKTTRDRSAAIKINIIPSLSQRQCEFVSLSCRVKDRGYILRHSGLYFASFPHLTMIGSFNCFTQPSFVPGPELIGCKN